PREEVTDVADGPAGYDVIAAERVDVIRGVRPADRSRTARVAGRARGVGDRGREARCIAVRSTDVHDLPAEPLLDQPLRRTQLVVELGRGERREIGMSDRVRTDLVPLLDQRGCVAPRQRLDRAGKV